MRRRGTAAVLAVATAAATLFVTPPAHANQVIAWQKCTDLPDIGQPTDRLECGTFRAPMDWNNPGRTITIAVSRLKPRDPKTTIFTNPGGPGLEGRTLPALYQDKRNLTEHAEIIGIDIRGTGASTNVSCQGFQAVGRTDPRDRSNAPRIYADMRKQARLCHSELASYLNTEQIVKDYDLLRRILRKSTVDYLGYSGGTWLGAHYATYFPKTLGKIVLDSNMEFTADWHTVLSAAGPGMERRIRTDFFPWVAKHDAVYHLGKTGDEVSASFERIRRQVAKPQDLDEVLLAAQASKHAFAGAARKIADHDTTPGTTPDSQVATNLAIVCNDTPLNADLKTLEREVRIAGKQYPLAGYYQPTAPCAFWHRPKLNLKRPNGARSALMVQSERDGSTPVEGARRAHAKFKNSRLLTVTDEGDHAIYGFGNACVDDVVERYLIDDTLPAHDLTCPGTGLPDPGTR